MDDNNNLSILDCVENKITKLDLRNTKIHYKEYKNDGGYVLCDSGVKVLLPGDCTPNELNNVLHSYNNINGTPLKLDLLKLPHHGSMRNITKSIVSEIECSNFVVSTKVNRKYCFPNKETVAKLICYRSKADETINIWFNYQESLEILGITEKEQEENNIKLNACHEFNI